MNVPPASRERSRTRIEGSFAVRVPKNIAPKHKALTSTPVAPNFTVFMRNRSCDGNVEYPDKITREPQKKRRKIQCKDALTQRCKEKRKKKFGYLTAPPVKPRTI